MQCRSDCTEDSSKQWYVIVYKRSIIKILNFIDAKTFVVYIAIGCSRWDWFKCAQAVHSARCSSECMEGLTSQACISHLGSSYDQCTNCFALAETIKKSGEYHAVYNNYAKPFIMSRLFPIFIMLENWPIILFLC